MIDSVSFAAAGNTDSMECSSSSSNSYISGETRDIECNRGRNASHIVESIKIKTHCTLEDEDLTLKAQNITGTCTLKGDCIGILVNLFCVDDDSSWSFLVDQPSVAIGATSSLSLPEGQVICGDIGGMVVALIEDACSLTLNTSTMTNLTEKAFACSISNIHNGLCPSSGSSSESVQIMSIEKRITKMELQTMRCQLSELRERGETITLRVVPIEDMWKISNDMKVICALFLMEKIAKMKMPQISKRHNSSSSFEKMNNVVIRNRLGGLYKHVKKKFDGK